uniref:PI3K/PI4K domain-containing protein n=1 Tax=Rhabditophanes sp. KR3021 TaxID=114890 RepID=A0AC35TWP0_9BILA
MNRSYVQEPSEYCFHPKNGVCPRCSLKASFVIDDEEEENKVVVGQVIPVEASACSLFRFFESNYFTIHHAMHYLQSSVDASALPKLGETLYKFPKHCVDFYLPQLMILYVNKHNVAECLHSYLMDRCKSSIEFCVTCCILLESFNTENWKLNKLACQGFKLRKQILNIFYRDGFSYDQITFRNPSIQSLQLNSCECIEEFELPQSNLFHLMKFVCDCGMKKVRPEFEFIQSLIAIGTDLKELAPGVERNERLTTHIQDINAFLPGRVWVPLSGLPLDVSNMTIEQLRQKYIKDNDEDDRGEESEFGEIGVDQKVLQESEVGQSSIFSESWSHIYSKIKAISTYSFLPNWTVLPVIVKTGDDLRQELIAYQILTLFEEIWTDERVPLYLNPYKITVLSQDAGLIEPIKNAQSLHQLKKTLIGDNESGVAPTLLEYFIDKYGKEDSVGFKKAQQNFVRSCGAYSLICYFLQVKDRHNGNILLDEEGHLIHIDFGFILSQSPKNLGFETSPFKLTPEIVDLMGGAFGKPFEEYKTLMLRGMIAARKHHDRIMTLMQIMTSNCEIPCFRYGCSLVEGMLERFHVQYTDDELHQLIFNMVEASRGSITTRLYDNFQYYTNGIM